MTKARPRVKTTCLVISDRCRDQKGRQYVENINTTRKIILTTRLLTGRSNTSLRGAELSLTCPRASWLLLCRRPRTTRRNRKLGSAQRLRSTGSSTFPPGAMFWMGVDHFIPAVISSASPTSPPRRVSLSVRVHPVPPAHPRTFIPRAAYSLKPFLMSPNPTGRVIPTVTFEWTTHHVILDYSICLLHIPSSLGFYYISEGRNLFLFTFVS